MSLISVIVPVYKTEPYLKRCVDSILSQTFRDFELILVDDGSPDKAGAICDAYAEADNRIVVIHQKNGGLSAARNAGIDWAFANSDSQWLTFIDSDDWVHPEMLEQLLAAAINLKTDISCCTFRHAHDFSSEFPSFSEGPELITPEYLYTRFQATAVVAWGKLYRRSCFTQIRFPVGKLHEDTFTTHLIAFAHPQIAYISAPYYNYFINQAGIMRSEWSPKKLDLIEAYETQLVFFKKHQYINSLNYCTILYLKACIF